MRSGGYLGCAYAKWRSIAGFWWRTEHADGSLRGYVARTLPGYSAILVSNRGAHEPRAGGTFRRGAGGVITGLLTLAEALGADWVACARSDAQRELAAKHWEGLVVPLAQSTGRLLYATPTREQY